jgi:hypothetical protein
MMANKGEEKLTDAEKRRREQMVQEARDAEMAPRLEEAYNASLRSPEMVKPKQDKKQSKAAGGKVKGYAAGGSASKRADGCATKGKTRGKVV